jgi:hypothetical protein
MNHIRRTLTFGSVVALAGCATSTHVDDKTASSTARLRGQRVYIYSFLDLRQQALGPKLVAAVHEQLVSRFTAAGAVTKLTEFRGTEVGQSFASTNQAAAVPVKATVDQNLGREKEFNPRYRFFVFPRSVSVQGTGNFFVVDWRMVDVTDDKEVWYMESRGSHMKMFLGDEFPTDRAKELVDGLFKEFGAKGLLSNS